MHCSLSLDLPPAILQIGIRVHGAEPTERYRLDGLWCLHLYRYKAEVRLNGTPYAIAPGHAGVTAPGVEMEYHFQGLSEHAYAHFVLSGFAAGGTQIPVMQPLGEDFAAVNAAFEEAIGWFPVSPRRAEARLWDILWRLAAPGTPPCAPAAPHPAVRRTVELIELRLAEPISVAALAAEVGLSHNHLTRLFRAHAGATVAGYITQRRLLRARHLLRHTTLPIKSIAAQVGIPDLHLFNKTVRRALGASPRRLREQESGGAAVNKSAKEPLI